MFCSSAAPTTGKISPFWMLFPYSSSGFTIKCCTMAHIISTIKINATTLISNLK